MRIAINTRFLNASKMEGFGWYTFEISKRLAQNHPEHTFIFFFDRAYDEKFVFASNVIPVILSPQARHPILFYLWFEFAVSRALKKHKADIFFSPDGYLSLKTKVPQICTIHDINFEHFPQDIPVAARKYLRYFFPKFARKAEKIVSVSEYSKRDIVKTYGIPEEKIKVIWNGVSPDYKKGKDAQINERYCEGKPYFIFVGSLHPRKNVQRLIDAFSLYRAAQSNGFELVIVGEKLWKKSTHLKIKQENEHQIHFTGHLASEDLVKVMANAKALVYVPYFEGFGIPIVEAMKCGVPVIAGNLTSLPEVVGDAGILVDPYDVSAICEAMKQLTNDEKLAKTLGQKGLERSELFSWDKTASEVWEEISKILVTK